MTNGKVEPQWTVCMNCGRDTERIKLTGDLTMYRCGGCKQRYLGKPDDFVCECGRRDLESAGAFPHTEMMMALCNGCEGRAGAHGGLRKRRKGVPDPFILRPNDDAT